MLLSELSYKPKLGGSHHGTMMLRMLIEGEDSPSASWDIMDVVNRCEQAAQMMKMKIKNILIEPNINADNEEITKLLMMLNDRGFVIGLVLDGYHVPIYLREAKFVQVVLTGPKWDNFKVSEIIYKPEGDPVEPEIMQNNIYAGKHIYLNNKKNTTKYIQFISNAKFLWTLIVPPLKDVSVDFLKE